jgi:hypothetical protein
MIPYRGYRIFVTGPVAFVYGPGQDAERVAPLHRVETRDSGKRAQALAEEWIDVAIKGVAPSKPAPRSRR